MSSMKHSNTTPNLGFNITGLSQAEFDIEEAEQEQCHYSRRAGSMNGEYHPSPRNLTDPKAQAQAALAQAQAHAQTNANNSYNNLEENNQIQQLRPTPSPRERFVEEEEEHGGGRYHRQEHDEQQEPRYESALLATKLAFSFVLGYLSINAMQKFWSALVSAIRQGNFLRINLVYYALLYACLTVCLLAFTVKRKVLAKLAYLLTYSTVFIHLSVLILSKIYIQHFGGYGGLPGGDGGGLVKDWYELNEKTSLVMELVLVVPMYTKYFLQKKLKWHHLGK